MRSSRFRGFIPPLRSRYETGNVCLVLPLAAISPRRRFGSLAGALVSVMILSGCFVNSPAQTTLTDSHGFNLSAGDLQVLDLLVISEGGGAPGIVTGYAVNEGIEPVTMQVSIEIDGQLLPLGRSIEVPTGPGVRLDGKDAGLEGGPEVVPLIVPKVPAIPGSLITLRVSTSEDASSARVAVMPPEAPYDIYDNELG